MIIKHIFIVYINKYYLYYGLIPYLSNKKKNIGVKHKILIFKKNVLCGISYMTTKKKDEANKYIAITKRYNTYKIIQFLKKEENIFLFVWQQKRV